MKTSSAQIDLFDDAPGYRETPRPAPRKRQAAAPPQAGWDDDDAAQRLEQSGRFRILRKLVPRIVIPRAESAFPNLAVLIDTETTGLNHAKDEVIEIGAVAFTYDNEGVIGDVVGVYSGLRQPSELIPAEITRLTGITDEMVAGQEIDFPALDALIEPADLVIAHNAAFDRPFCENLSRTFAAKAWACSVKEVPWADLGFEGNKLGYLVGQSGLFHEGHRATDDCHALLEVLARPVGENGKVLTLLGIARTLAHAPRPAISSGKASQARSARGMCRVRPCPACRRPSARHGPGLRSTLGGSGGLGTTHLGRRLGSPTGCI